MSLMANRGLISTLSGVRDALQASAHIVQRHLVHLPKQVAADLGLELFEDVAVERRDASGPAACR